MLYYKYIYFQQTLNMIEAKSRNFAQLQVLQAISFIYSHLHPLEYYIKNIF